MFKQIVEWMDIHKWSYFFIPLILGVFTFILLQINHEVNALEYKDTCINVDSLQKFMNFTTCENNNCTFYNFTQVKDCEFGCDNTTNACRQPKIIEYGYYVIGFIAIIIVAIYLLRK